MNGLDIVLMVSIRKDAAISKDNTSLESFFLLSYSELCTKKLWMAEPIL